MVLWGEVFGYAGRNNEHAFDWVPGLPSKHINRRAPANCVTNSLDVFARLQMLFISCVQCSERGANDLRLLFEETGRVFTFFFFR